MVLITFPFPNSVIRELDISLLSWFKRPVHKSHITCSAINMLVEFDISLVWVYKITIFSPIWISLYFEKFPDKTVHIWMRRIKSTSESVALDLQSVEWKLWKFNSLQDSYLLSLRWLVLYWLWWCRYVYYRIHLLHRRQSSSDPVCFSSLCGVCTNCSWTRHSRNQSLSQWSQYTQHVWSINVDSQGTLHHKI